MTAVLGMLGSLVGGLFINVLGGRALFDLNAAGFVGSMIGAILVLVAVGAGGRRRRLV